MKRLFITGLMLISTSVFAGSSDITSDTTSNAQQQSSMQNNISIGGNPADTTVRYHGSYDMKTAPTVYAPGLTASATETCWGSVSGSVSVVGLGVSGGSTVIDTGCNRRLNASVAWKMNRKDVAFNIMCKDPEFREAAELTLEPCIPVQEQASTK